MTSNQRNWLTLTVAFATVSAAALAYLGFAGSNDETIRLLLRLSARVAFLIYLLAFIARPLQQLYATSFSRGLLRNRRQVGIAFAGVHTAHLGLIFYRAQQNPDFEFSLAANLPGAFFYLVILMMLITSFDGPARAIGRKAWKALHKTGIYLIGIPFVSTLLPRSQADLLQPEYLLSAILIVGAVLLRVAAYVRTRTARGGT